MARKRRGFTVFSLSFLDVMSCGFGAVILVYIIINHATEARSDELNQELLAEVSLLEKQVFDGEEDLVEKRNSLERTREELVITEGAARRIIEQMKEIQVELASRDDATLARVEHINKLKVDIKQREEDIKRLQESLAEEEERGTSTREFVGEGDRQYLTALKMGGSRVLILLDASASMLDESIVNIIIRRNLPDAQKVNARKWQRAVNTVDWITTQIPTASKFQIYTFNTAAKPLLEGTNGKWLDTGDGKQLDDAVKALRTVVPDEGTSLHAAFAVVNQMQPRPDNIFLIVDGLPTQGDKPPRRATVNGQRRLRLFDQSLRELPSGIPVNIIMFPIEGDPMAASAYWQLAMATGGSYMSPSKDWP